MEVVPFHRYQLETAALAISAHSHTSWYGLRKLLDARGGADLAAVPATELLGEHEMVQLGLGDLPSPKQPPPTFCFHQLSVRASECGLGVLIGWHRHGGSNGGAPQAVAASLPPEINPKDKEEQVCWRPDDLLIVVQREELGEEGNVLRA